MPELVSFRFWEQMLVFAGNQVGAAYQHLLCFWRRVILSRHLLASIFSLYPISIPNVGVCAIQGSVLCTRKEKCLAIWYKYHAIFWKKLPFDFGSKCWILLGFW